MAGQEFRLHATGKMVWNNGDDFGILQSLEYDEPNDQMVFDGALTVAGRIALAPGAPLFANGNVTLDSKAASHYQIVLTGTGHADNVTLSNPQTGAIALITFYADAGQAISWAADMRFHGGTAPTTGPAVGKVLNVLAVYDDILTDWFCRVFTDDPALAAAFAPEPPGLAAHLADAVDAHDASAISYAGSSGLAADDVEEALDELDTEKAPRGGAVSNAQTGTSYTPVLADAGKWVTLTNAGAITLTIPTNASVAFPIDTEIHFSAEGAGEVTITPAGGVTVNNRGGRTKSNGQFAVWSIKKTDTNTWTSYGDLKT